MYYLIASPVCLVFCCAMVSYRYENIFQCAPLAGCIGSAQILRSFPDRTSRKHLDWMNAILKAYSTKILTKERYLQNSIFRGLSTPERG